MILVELPSQQVIYLYWAPVIQILCVCVVVVVLFLFMEIHILLFVNFRSHDKFKNSDVNFAIVYLTIYFRGCHVHIPIAVPRILSSFNCIIIDGCGCSLYTTSV